MSNQSNDHALPNGFTFLAITGGYYGSWAKAHDPITAIKKAYKAEGGQGRKLVKVIYGKDEELHCTDMGGFQWEHGNPPTPIGLFTVESRIIKPPNTIYPLTSNGWKKSTKPSNGKRSAIRNG
ncbi:MAG: hypothetical protein VW445_09310 [Rhodospirillaceae bacterium]